MAIMSKIIEYTTYIDHLKKLKHLEDICQVKIIPLTLENYINFSSSFYEIYYERKLIGYINKINTTIINQLKDHYIKENA
jgi:hypothetical protein